MQCEHRHIINSIKFVDKNFLYYVPIGFFTSNIKKIKFPNDYNRDFKVGVFVEGLEYLYLGKSYNQTLEKGLLPSSLKHFYLGGKIKSDFPLSSINYFKTIEKDVLPDNLQHLSISGRLADDFTFPQNLKSLHLLKVSNLKLDPGYLPNTITDLHFGHSSLAAALKFGDIPDSCLKLNFGFFGAQLSHGVLPQNLLDLHMGTCIGSLLKEGVVPNTLTNLVLPNNNVPLKVGCIPMSIKKLKMGFSYNSPITGVIPSSVEKLYLSPSFKQPLQVGDIPASVTKLKVKSVLNLNQKTLPSNLKSLTFNPYIQTGLQPNDLPHGLVKLKNFNYHQDLEKVIPDSVKDLSIILKTCLKPGFIPTNVERLRIQCNKANLFVAKDVIPTSVKYLEFKCEQRESIQKLYIPNNIPIIKGTLVLSALEKILEPNEIPPCITKLYYHSSQPLLANIVPKTLKSLIIGDEYDGQTLLKDSLPIGLESLLICNNSIKFIGELDFSIPIGFFTSNIKKIKFPNDYNKEFKVGIFVEGLEYLYLGKSYNQFLEKGLLPCSLKHFFLGAKIKDQSFTQITSIINENVIEKDVLPDNLQHLSISGRLADDFTFPQNLKSLHLLKVSNLKLDPGYLPNTITDLHLGYSTILERLDIGSIPNGCLKLNFGYHCYEPLIGLLPLGIVDLHLGVSFGCNVLENFIPNTVTNLVLPNNNTPLQPGCIPMGIKKLRLGYSYNSPITGVIPSSVEKLYLSTTFKQQLQVGDIPASVTKLKVESVLNFGQNILPSNLKSLTLPLYVQITFQPNDLPLGLVKLKHLNYFQQEKIIPKSVRNLSIILSTNTLKPGFIPTNVEKLKIQSMKKANLFVGKNVIPTSVKYLEFELSQHGSIQKLQIPNNIPIVKGTLYLAGLKKPLEPNEIPTCITKLYYLDAQPLLANVFPKTLKTLYIASHLYIHPLLKDSLPIGLEGLHRFDSNICKYITIIKCIKKTIIKR
ncbi:hypothetical protein CYY_003715 [Polysphondylium violaceum]|uniref:FNIP repeat-containing protein n=1 Tax=Polysphondylium violaceum TaxID=133409 RepID=A0A8J4PWJ4_9MYCE|nr:hypothetical protein CYY_003715 [Polysphondylium violaceum]